MTEMIIDIEKLGESIAKHLQHKDDWWSSDRCAKYLDIKGGAKSFLLYTASHPTFPQPTSLPTIRNEKRGLLRWNPDEVKEWAQSFKRKPIT